MHVVMDNLCDTDIAYLCSSASNIRSRSFIALATSFYFSSSELAEVSKNNSLPFLYKFKAGSSLIYLLITEIDISNEVVKMTMFLRDGAQEAEPLSDWSNVSYERLISLLNLDLKNPKISIAVFEEEVGEQRLLESLGLTREARLISQVFVEGGFRNLCLYGKRGEQS